MINRINLLLQAKNITAKQFAEEIGIQPSGMSHILGGRNNPSLEFVAKVLRRYPEIDANWLLLGRGSMYNSGNPSPAPAPTPQDTLPEMQPSIFSLHQSTPALPEIPDSELLPPTETTQPAPAQRAARRLVKLLLVYDDNSFEECQRQ